MPGGRQRGCRDRAGNIQHRPGPGRDAPGAKSVWLIALVGGDERIVKGHEKAVGRTLVWTDKNAVETRMQRTRLPGAAG